MLRNFLEEYLDDKEFVQETIHVFANVADGVAHEE